MYNRSCILLLIKACSKLINKGDILIKKLREIKRGVYDFNLYSITASFTCSLEKKYIIVSLICK